MTRARLALLIAAAILIAFWAVRSPMPTGAKPSNGETIIAFGDSLVAGRGASPGKDFVSVLSQRVGVPIINAGRSGDTTGAALVRLDRDVLDRNPRMVIVVLGGNDFLRRLRREKTFKNLGRIVERIRAHGSAVVLVGVRVGLLGDPYADEYEELARRTSSILVPDILDGVIGRQGLMADAIHPNDRGYNIIAGRLAPIVRDLMH